MKKFKGLNTFLGIMLRTFFQVCVTAGEAKSDIHSNLQNAEENDKKKVYQGI